MPANNIINNQSMIITTFTTSGVWTKNPNTKFVLVIALGAGSGGGSGRTTNPAVSNAGGGGGGITSGSIYYYSLGSFFNTTETVTISSGGAGAAAQTTPDTNGIKGSGTGITSLGSYIAIPANSSLGGNGGLNNAGSGTVSAGNALTNVGTQLLLYTSSAGSSTTSTAPVGYRISFPMSSAGGGGSGSSNSAAQQAASSGALFRNDNALIVSGATGGIDTGLINGSNGILVSMPTNSLATIATGGGGGGGAYLSANGGTGGNAGGPSAGGGGGGGGPNTGTSGAGGNGGPGIIWIYEWL